MPEQQPARRFHELKFGGVLDEGKTPREVGMGLTSSLNNTYRRFGSWGKRPGSAQIDALPSFGAVLGVPQSGVRWYRGYPSTLTQTIVASGGALWKSGDPGSGFSLIAQLQQYTNGPVRFCSARDPAALDASGCDVLIIVGLTGPYSFAKGTLTLTGTPTAGDLISVNLKNAAGVVVTTVGPYSVLPNDNIASIAAEIVSLINESAAVVNGGNGYTGPPLTPFMSQAMSANIPIGATTGTVTLAALRSGSAGNSIQYEAVISHPTGGSMTFTPGGYTNLFGGGLTVSSPLKWDGTNLWGLSPYITNPFTGCSSWHSHVWFFGDPANPDTLFATDIDTAEGWSFMTQNGGGGSTGGYDIGAGDGDAFIRGLLDIGNIQYVWKGQNIYAVTGYDFQGGEYQFSVEPAIKGHGAPTQECITKRGNAAVFWDGSKVLRLQVGAYDVEPIGSTIPFTSGLVAKGNQALIRAVSGDFVISAAPLDGSYEPPTLGTGSEVFDDVVMFAVDVGNGIADTVLVFDNKATGLRQEYAWSKWTGISVDGWIPFGDGRNAAGTAVVEPEILTWLPPIVASTVTPSLQEFGASATQDDGQPIPWMVQTGWIDVGTLGLTKNLHRVFAFIEATPGVNLTALCMTATPLIKQPYVPNTTDPRTRAIVFPVTTGDSGVEALQVPIAQLEPFLPKCYSFMLMFSEAGSNTTFELVGALLDYVEEAYRP